MSHDLLRTERTTPRAPGVLVLLVIVFASGLSGCNVARGIRDYVSYNSPTEDFVTGWRDGVWARRAYNRRRGQLDPGPFEADFRAGFIAGYRNIASGGDGCTPSLPPRNYWSWRYQSAEGQAKVNAWFSGFPFGARAAEEDGAGNYYEIQIASWLEDGSRGECADCMNDTSFPENADETSEENGGLYFEEVDPVDPSLDREEGGLPTPDEEPMSPPTAAPQDANPLNPPTNRQGNLGGEPDTELLDYLDRTFSEPQVKRTSYGAPAAEAERPAAEQQQRLPPVSQPAGARPSTSTAPRPGVVRPVTPAASGEGVSENQKSMGSRGLRPDTVERFPRISSETQPDQAEPTARKRNSRSLQQPLPQVPWRSLGTRSLGTGKLGTTAGSPPVLHDTTRFTEGWPRVSLYR